MTFEQDIKDETSERGAILFLIGHDTANEIGELTHEMREQCEFDITEERVQALVNELVSSGKLIEHLPFNAGEPVQYSTRYTPVNY